MCQELFKSSFDFLQVTAICSGSLQSKEQLPAYPGVFSSSLSQVLSLCGSVANSGILTFKNKFR